MVLMCLAILWSSGVVFVTVTAAWYIAAEVFMEITFLDAFLIGSCRTV